MFSIKTVSNYSRIDYNILKIYDDLAVVRKFINMILKKVR